MVTVGGAYFADDRADWTVVRNLATIRPWDGAPISILLVDDEASSRMLALETLQSRGHHAITAGSAKEALSYVERHNFDVIVLDLGLPDMDGLDLCRRIRNSSDVYILMLTGRTEEDDRIIGLASGADDYVGKPFSPVELAMRVETMMRRPRQDASDEIVSNSELELNRKTREVTLSGQPVKLTSVEYTILETLLTKRGAVTTRDELANACWGEDSEDDDHVIAVHMANLRKKIGCDGSQVSTVAGVGYRLSLNISQDA